MSIEGGADAALDPRHLERIKLEEQVALAGIDYLTKLKRYEQLIPILEKLIEELNYPNDQRRSSLSAIIVLRLDINNFKVFNERPYSHKVGNNALFAFAERLRELTQERHDTLFRVGGDEFAVIMPIIKDGMDYRDFFLKIQKRINENLFVQVGKVELKMSASMGYSVILVGEVKTAEQLIDEADKMEREEKEKFRKRNLLKHQ